MKGFLKYLFLCWLISISIGASAHSPDVSTTLIVEESDDHWVLQIRAALTAFEYEVEYHFGAESYATPEEFQELVIQHVQKQTSIYANEIDQVQLLDGVVKLGHETSVTFKLTGIPSELKLLELTNASFKEIPRNQSALMLLKKGFEKNQFRLDRNNQHKARLKISESKFELEKFVAEKTSFPIKPVIASLFVFMAITVAYKFIRT